MHIDLSKKLVSDIETCIHQSLLIVVNWFCIVRSLVSR